MSDSSAINSNSNKLSRNDSPFFLAIKAFEKSKISVVGLIFILLVAVVAVSAPVISPFDPRQQSVINRLKPPDSYSWLGTDQYGRDILSRVIYGSRISLLVGLVSVTISAALGTLLGMISGMSGGKIDQFIGACVDMSLAFPDLMLGLLVVIIIGPGLSGVIIAIAASMVPRFIRVARACTLSLREYVYIEASKAIGASDFRIILRHILPNILGNVVIMSTLWMASAIRIEASLSFLGMGVQPPIPTWGNMIRDGLGVIFIAPWLATVSGAAIMLTVLAFNMIGDGLRDALDPKSSI